MAILRFKDSSNTWSVAGDGGSDGNDGEMALVPAILPTI